MPLNLDRPSYSDELLLNRPRNRYDKFRAAEVRIHPFKRAMALVSKCLPRRWRFFLLGLPPCAQPSESEQPKQSGDVRSLRNGIACQNGAHLNASGAYLPSITSGAGPFIESRFLQKQRCLPRIRKVRGTVLSLASDGDLNYYRWLMETLPRTRYLKDFPAGHDWIYCRQQKQFHRTTLQLLGGHGSHFLSSDSDPYVQGSSIQIPPFVDEDEDWIIPWLRERFLPLAQSRSPQGSKRIYLSRAKAAGRRIAREAEFQAALDPYGFRSVNLEDHDWLDQVALLRDAEVVVAPHGAGLTNIVFCQPRALIIELIAPKYPYTFFPRISRQLNLDHRFIECTPTDPSHVHGSDLQVDFKSLQEFL